MKYILMITAFVYSNSMCLTPILNNPTRICKNCVHYIENKEKCGLFFDVDMVTGDKTYQYASIVRKNEKKCGNEAKYYSENNLQTITVPYYFANDHFFLFLLISSYTYCLSQSVKSE